MSAIDCLLIGHNQEPFGKYEETVAKMGSNCGAYRDLNKNFIRYNNTAYSAADAFNLFYRTNGGTGKPVAPIRPVEAFSAGIAYLGTWLHRRGFTFDYINSFQDEKEELARMLEKGDILTAAVLTTLYITIFPVLEIIKFIRKHNRNVKIIVGGPLVSTKIRVQNPGERDNWLRTVDADFYVNSSQGEAALTKLLHALKNNLPFDRIDNIHYKQKNGSGYAVTKVSREDNPLSENMVNWELFGDRIGEFVNVRTSISCPFSCSFCGFPRHAGKYQTANVDDVEKELNRLEKTGKVKLVNFIDDTFNFPPDRFKKLLGMMINNNYSFKWHSYFRCQYADEETVLMMKESGCQGVFLGLESGSDRILKNMNKATSVKKYLDGIALLKKYGIVTLGNFVIGFPGETGASVRETTRFIKESGIDFYRVQLWYCEHITPIWQLREQYGLTGESFEWSHNTMNSKQASDTIDELILSLDEPVCLPQYYFDYENVFQLMAKGIGPEQVKRFLNAFNDGIKEKLRSPSRQEVSFDIIDRLSRGGREDDSPAVPSDTGENVMEKYGLKFEF